MLVFRYLTYAICLLPFSLSVLHAEEVGLGSSEKALDVANAEEKDTLQEPMLSVEKTEQVEKTTTIDDLDLVQNVKLEEKNPSQIIVRATLGQSSSVQKISPQILAKNISFKKEHNFVECSKQANMQIKDENFFHFIGKIEPRTSFSITKSKSTLFSKDATVEISSDKPSEKPIEIQHDRIAVTVQENVKPQEEKELQTITKEQSPQQSQLLQRIKSEMLAKDYELVGKLLGDNLGKDHGRKLRLSELSVLAEELKFQPLTDAVQATRNFFVHKRNIGINPGEFLKTAFFINIELPNYIKNRKYYLKSRDTGLRNTIEHDRKTGNTYIVLDGDASYVGSGKKKTVYMAILFDQKESKIFARAEQSIPMDMELKMCKLLRNAPGILNTYAFTHHKEKGQKFSTIYSELFSPGSLRDDVFEPNKFSDYEIAKIFHGILKGLESLHTRNLVHRDLHSKNYLINIPKGKIGRRNIQAVIADLGRTIHIKEANGIPVQGATKYCPPEGLFRKKMKGKDYFASDIYAVGCVFYRLLHNKIPTWQDRSYLKDTKLSKRKNQRILIKKLKKENDERRTSLASKKAKGILPAEEDLELLILNMVNANPAMRTSAAKLRAEVERILMQMDQKSVPNSQ
jgi:hypothetical protein